MISHSRLSRCKGTVACNRFLPNGASSALSFRELHAYMIAAVPLDHAFPRHLLQSIHGSSLWPACE
jgi:hypothetical protein